MSIRPAGDLFHFRETSFSSSKLDSLRVGILYNPFLFFKMSSDTFPIKEYHKAPVPLIVGKQGRLLISPRSETCTYFSVLFSPAIIILTGGFLSRGVCTPLETNIYAHDSSSRLLFLGFPHILPAVCVLVFG